MTELPTLDALVDGPPSPVASLAQAVARRAEAHRDRFVGLPLRAEWFPLQPLETIAFQGTTARVLFLGTGRTAAGAGLVARVDRRPIQAAPEEHWFGEARSFAAKLPDGSLRQMNVLRPRPGMRVTLIAHAPDGRSRTRSFRVHAEGLEEERTRR